MRTIKTTEKFDGDGKLVERVTETTDTFETQPYYPWNQMPMPNTTTTNPQITWTYGTNC